MSANVPFSEVSTRCVDGIFFSNREGRLEGEASTLSLPWPGELFAPNAPAMIFFTAGGLLVLQLKALLRLLYLVSGTSVNGCDSTAVFETGSVVLSCDG